MSITPGYIFIFKSGMRNEKSTYCGMSFNRFSGFFESASLMNEGVPINLEYWVQILTAIAELSSTDHSSDVPTWTDLRGSGFSSLDGNLRIGLGRGDRCRIIPVGPTAVFIQTQR